MTKATLKLTEELFRFEVMVGREVKSKKSPIRGYKLLKAKEDAYRLTILESRAIISSGFSETVRVKKTQEMGAGQYIRKPYTLTKIGMAVKRALGS